MMAHDPRGPARDTAPERPGSAAATGPGKGEFSPRSSDRWIVTCEHGRNRIPEAYQELFRGAEEILESHRGWDRGALAVWRKIVDAGLADAAFHSTTTRLLVDLNRSSYNPAVFSPWTRPLPRPVRRRLIDRYHHPYRQAVEAAAAELLGDGGRVVHWAIHSFTPVLNGVVRTADVGVLYDPTRPGERSWGTAFIGALALQGPDLRIRRNYPYRGRMDGLPTTLRKRFGEDFLGIEIELNQALFDVRGEDAVAELVIGALRELHRSSLPPPSREKTPVDTWRPVEEGGCGRAEGACERPG
jgi:predicted N-formylglutamate amidohydrolase